MEQLRTYENRLKKVTEGIGPGTFFVLCGLVHLVALYPLFRANFNYIDDLGRVAEGYAGWDNFSRYLSNFLSHFIHTGMRLLDISPLPQLIAVCVMVSAGMAAIRLICGKGHFSLWELAAVLPLSLSPYFLECFSYKFDAPYMALSVFASILPLLLRDKKPWIYGIGVFAGILSMCMTYQVSAGIFPMLVILLALKDVLKGRSWKETVCFILRSAFFYLLTLLCFSLFFMQATEAYISNDIAGPALILDHYIQYLTWLRSDFKTEWMGLMTLSACLFVISSGLRAKSRRWLFVLLAAVCVVLMFLLSFGLYPALVGPIFAPRAMYGVGVFLAFMDLFVVAETSESSGICLWMARLVAVVMAWCFVVFACTYGNALAAQDEYTEFRIEEVLGDLTDLPEFYQDHEKVVQLTGSIGQAPVIRNMPKDYGMLDRLLPLTFSGGWGWAGYRFYHYYGLQNVAWGAVDPVAAEQLPVRHESMYHVISGEGENFIIYLK